MKTFHTISMFATLTTAVVMPQQHSELDVRGLPQSLGHANHTADGAAVYNPSPDLEKAASVNEVCIGLLATDPEWWWRRDGPWGNSIGQFKDLPDNKMCVPTNDGAGGAIFVGKEPNPGPGSTKIECYFPTSGTANCDISLVDGYSLDVSCLPQPNPYNVKIGFETEGLWDTGIPCPHLEGSKCINDNGYAATEAEVDPFFQKGIEGGNNYCIWVNCSQDYYFPVTSKLSCWVME